MSTIKSWEVYYDNNSNEKPFVPESFIARIFLSQRPIKLLNNYSFQNKTILDLGCGDGRHIDFFHKLGFITTGTEISLKKVTQLKDKFKKTNFNVATAGNLPYDNNSFDYVAAINSIYYLDENDTLHNNIKSCVDVLKPGGVFIVSFVGKNHFILKNDSSTINYGNHQCDNEIFLQSIVSKKEIKKLFEYQKIKIDYIGEIHDKIEKYDRHLFYVIGTKNNDIIFKKESY